MTAPKPATAIQRYVTEAIGVFFLCFAGIMAIKGDVLGAGIGLLGIAFAHGIALACAVAGGGHISGAHYNPAVTFGLALFGRIGWNYVPGYFVSQLAGGVFAVLCANAISSGGGMGACLPGVGVSAGQAVFAEIVLTFFLAYVVSAVGTDNSSAGSYIAPLAIGLTVFFDILAGGPVSGACMNPARWFGPAIVSSNFTAGWVYLVGPFVGGALGVGAYQFVRTNK